MRALVGDVLQQSAHGFTRKARARDSSVATSIRPTGSPERTRCAAGCEMPVSLASW
jgi:hypothetical protein